MGRNIYTWFYPVFTNRWCASMGEALSILSTNYIETHDGYKHKEAEDFHTKILN
jgi:hypothetical protein